MTDNQDLVKCPVCEGHGEVRRAELTERLSGGDLTSKKADSSALEQVEGDAEFAGATAGDNKARDFQKDVHSWNPQLPMWRRSPKE